MTPKKHLLTKHLPVSGFIVIGLLALTGFVKPNTPNVINTLTIKSANGNAVELFDLVVMGKTSTGDHYSKMQKSTSTPFELQLDTGTYTIVINRTSKDGKIIGKIVQYEGGKSGKSAASDDKIIVLIIDDEGDYSAAGM